MATVLALHAFTRGPQHLSAFANACGGEGWTCIRPAVAPRWLPILTNSRRHIAQVASRLMASGRLAGPVVIVGHSAGAAAGAWMAPLLRSAGVEVAGLVFVDGNDSPNHLIERSWSQLTDLPIRAVMAPANPCNRHGRLTAFLDERRPGSTVIVPGSGHGDLEMLGARVYRRACGDRSGPAQWQEVQREVIDAIRSLFTAAGAPGDR